MLCCLSLSLPFLSSFPFSAGVMYSSLSPFWWEDEQNIWKNSRGSRSTVAYCFVHYIYLMKVCRELFLMSPNLNSNTVAHTLQIYINFTGICGAPIIYHAAILTSHCCMPVSHTCISLLKTPTHLHTFSTVGSEPRVRSLDILESLKKIWFGFQVSLCVSVTTEGLLAWFS